MDELMVKKLQNLLDKVAIEDKIKLYAQNLDTKNFENMRAVFMPGAHIDYTVAGGACCCFEEMSDVTEDSFSGPLHRLWAARSSYRLPGFGCRISH